MRISVIGAGSFGTALAKLLSENGHDVLLWSHSADTAEAIRKNHENTIYLKGIPLPESIRVTTDFSEAAGHAELIVSATPTQAIREVYSAEGRAAKINTPVVVASKGIEKKSHMLVCDIFKDIFGEEKKDNLFFLSGPSFAREMALKMPTAITIAGYDTAKLPDIQKVFHNEYFRAYATPDVIGVELGGALKNVMAIATGIADGLKFGSNTRAMIITRGLAEIARLGEKLGAKPITFMGLGGMGDLVLTCTGDLSRNRTVGLKLGQGMTLAEIQAEMRMVAEGVPTTESAHELAAKLSVDLPITAAVYKILYEKIPALEALKDLSRRSIKFE
jgi:glycerol-3-phosphate dehydrogenase (NAD(P)+)